MFCVEFEMILVLPEGRLCARSSSTVAHMPEELSDENDETSDGAGEDEDNVKWSIDPVTGIQYVQCTRQTHHCYALWSEDPSGNGTIIMGQGKINYFCYNY